MAGDSAVGDRWLPGLATGRTESTGGGPQRDRGILCDRRRALVLDGRALHRLAASEQNKDVRAVSGLQGLGRANRGALWITEGFQPKARRPGIQNSAFHGQGG